MKTDKELLMLAAKAAGYETYSWSDKIVITDRRDSIWNPLADDGDAFRLAVDLDMDVCLNPTEKEVTAYAICSVLVAKSESYGADKRSATRIAIVRAAASIGEAME